MPGITGQVKLEAGQSSVDTGVPENQPQNLEPTVQQILNCSFSSWYPKFSKHSPNATVLQAPSGFVDYLLSDGIMLPHDEEESQHESEPVGETTEDPSKYFASFHDKIKQTISDLGGEVTPKLNWSSPKDAVWISPTKNTKCNTATEIYMLLKASNYITHDLTDAFDGCVDYDPSNPPNFDFDLVLRKWVEFNPSVEFRVFVKDREIIGITQRDMNYYEFLAGMKDELEEKIHDFFEDHVREEFPDPHFVFDVYIPRPFNRVWLVDFNPFADKTDTLLFSWDQLKSYNPLAKDFEADFRLVDKQDSTRGFGYVEHSESYVPKDFVEAGLGGQGVVEIAEQMRKMLAAQEKEDEDDGHSSAGE